MASCAYVCCAEFGCGLCNPTSGDVWRVNGGAYGPVEPYLTARGCPISCVWNRFFWFGSSPNEAQAYPLLKLPGCGGLDVSNLYVGMEAFTFTFHIKNFGDVPWCGCYYWAVKFPTSTRVWWNWIGPCSLCNNFRVGSWDFNGVDYDEIWGNGIVCEIVCGCGCDGNHNDFCTVTCMCFCCFDSARSIVHYGAKIWVDGDNIRYTDVRYAFGLTCGYIHCIKNDGNTYNDVGPAYWKLDGNANDSVGSNNGGATGITYVTGHNGSNCSAVFDNVADNICVPDDASMQNLFAGGGSVSAWVYPCGAGTSIHSRIVDKSGWGVYTTCITTLRFFYVAATCIGTWGACGNLLNQCAWNHVVVSWDSCNPTVDPKMFVNGSEAVVTNSCPLTGALCSDVGYDLYMGQSQGASRDFNGILDNVWLFDTAIDIGNVTSLCSGDLPGSPGNYWVPDSNVLYINYVDCNGNIRRTHNGTIFTYDTWLGFEDFLGCTRGAAACGHIWADTFYNYGLVAINGCGVQFKISNGTVFNNCEDCVVP